MDRYMSPRDNPYGQTNGRLSEPETENADSKIITLYEVIADLMNELDARSYDIYNVAEGNYDISEEVMQRNDEFMKSIRASLQIDRINSQASDSDDDDDEDAQTVELFGQITDNVNSYTDQFEQVIAAFQERERDVADVEAPLQAELDELEAVLEAQTGALDSQTSRVRELEHALESVLRDYSDKIAQSNEKINSLSQQLTLSHQANEEQVTQLQNLYRREVNSIKALHDDEASQLHDEAQTLRRSLQAYREEFDAEMLKLTTELTTAQRNHRIEIGKWSNKITTLQNQLQDRNLKIFQMERGFEQVRMLKRRIRYLTNREKNLVDSLEIVRTPINIYQLKESTAATPGRRARQAARSAPHVVEQEDD